MNVEITGRHIEVTPALREFTEDKLHKLTRLLDGPLEVHVVLAIEKHRHMAEIQVKSRTAVFSGAHETGDLYASISDVADKLERQALKHKEKLQHHKQRRGPRDPEIAATIEANASSAENPPVKPMAPAAARIIRTRRCRAKPCSAEDALLELEATGEQLLLFRDHRTDRVQVLYRMGNGDFGLVESEF